MSEHICKYIPEKVLIYNRIKHIINHSLKRIRRARDRDLAESSSRAAFVVFVMIGAVRFLLRQASVVIFRTTNFND